MENWFATSLLAIIPLFVAIDPIGLTPLFFGMTKGMTIQQRRSVANQAIWTAAIVAIGFMFLGKFIFRALGIGVSDFQIAGGLILLVLASRDLLNTDLAETPIPKDAGVVPLGLPLIVGPATLTTLLILIDTVGVRFTLFGLLINLFLLMLALRFADKLLRWIGLTGLRALTKIISLLLAAIAVNMIRRGWQSL
jgi:multiple antibiotic resistance protein